MSENMKHVGDSDFLDIAKDEVSARVLRKQLQEIARHDPNGLLGEMARDVLGGRVSLREAMRNSVYTEELGRHTERFRRFWQEAAPEEREQAQRQAAEFFEQQRRDIEEERKQGRS
ncbi:hypothetical protein [Allostreptomyces psammosilenae]|uniref:Putative membrane protein YccC n=1 Tax=Allostreptomyces psammosilenae TaxID=1892865 RepID=A0A852ZW76_9ACTN|nr:hypothetical protein [Allostreptomyces psammosilenae]NYI06469.1 putative membrane protein YccC [Allostreptomyces psammosilenae]